MQPSPSGRDISIRKLTSFLLLCWHFAGPTGVNTRSAELEGALQYPPLSGQRGCATPATGQNGSVARIAFAHGIGCQPAEYAAQHGTIVYPVSDPLRSIRIIASDRKRRKSVLRRIAEGCNGQIAPVPRPIRALLSMQNDPTLSIVISYPWPAAMASLPQTAPVHPMLSGYDEKLGKGLRSGGPTALEHAG